MFQKFEENDDDFKAGELVLIGIGDLDNAVDKHIDNFIIYGFLESTAFLCELQE
mgnify:CR=1 FL=1